MQIYKNFCIKLEIKQGCLWLVTVAHERQRYGPCDSFDKTNSNLEYGLLLG